LKDKITKLTEDGATALGPALLLASAIASQKARSEVIICTDGIPNVGVGSLDGEDEEVANAGVFYHKVGDYAKSNNTIVSVIGIEGTDGALSSLSACSEMTSGTVNILHPLELVRQIRQLTQNPVVATNVELSVLVHPDLEFSRQDSPQALSRIVKEIANVNTDTDYTFEYRSRARAKGKWAATYPFQVQVKFTRLDGMQVLRVISAQRPTTQNREAMEKTCNISLIGLSAVHHASILAHEENGLVSARLKLRAAQKMFQRVKDNGTDVQYEEFANYLTQADILDAELEQAAKKRKGLSKKLDDSTIKTLFAMRTIPRNLFLSGTKKRVEKRKGDVALNKQYYEIRF